MTTAYETGTIFSGAIPAWQRTYYEALLLETLRTSSIMVPFCTVKEDFSAKQTGLINYTEVYDTDPNYNPMSETDIWMKGAHLDSRSVTISMEIHGDTLKFSDYSDVVQYLNSGNLRGLVSEKIGQNMKDTLDILARNAFLAHPSKVYAGGTRASRLDITATDLFDPDFAELARTHLEEAEVPGVQQVEDNAGQTIVCVTTPRVIHDIRTAAGSGWLEVQNYMASGRKFTNEVGTWGGVRFIRTQRLVLPNHGKVTVQTTLTAPTVAGQGAAATVDVVYSPGQPTSTRYIPVDDTTGFLVGQRVTIHDQDCGAGAGKPPVESDGTQESRRIVAVDAGGKKLVFDKPLLKDHRSGDFITFGINIHTAIFMGGPAVVYGIGERPTPVFPPKFDDLMMVNRFGWRGFVKFQLFRPEYVEIHEIAGSIG